MQTVTLPELGEGISDAVVACWHFREGDSVSKDDDLLEVVTDKASFNIPTHFSGKIKKIHVREGDQAKVGQSLVDIE